MELAMAGDRDRIGEWIDTFAAAVNDSACKTLAVLCVWRSDMPGR